MKNELSSGDQKEVSEEEVINTLVTSQIKSIETQLY
jgi:hypothetical protein